MPSTREIGRADVDIDLARHTPMPDDDPLPTADPTTTAPDWHALRERVRADPALLDALLQRVATVAAPPTRLRWINAAIGRDVSLIDVHSVLSFQSDHKYTRVVTAEREALIRRPLKLLMNELDPEAFWPIHRAVIVNVTAIAGITRDARGRALVKLKARSERLLVSAGCEHLFRQM